MKCVNPRQGFRDKKGKLIFKEEEAVSSNVVQVNCGQCVACRVNRASEWAVRCVHEASLYEDNCFITLTMNNEYLFSRDNPMSLDKKEHQDFMKRLRKRFGNGIRYFHCGEYGDKNKRPHYHTLLFNFTFPDLVLWKVNNGVKWYRSNILEELWPYGHCIVGEVTKQSAAYVARYNMKKIVGQDAKEHYLSVDVDTGEAKDLLPEYVSMSLKPGIGKAWFDNYLSDVFPKDFVVLDGSKSKPPGYYYKILERDFPDMFRQVRDKRELAIPLESFYGEHDESYDRKQVRKIVYESRLKKLVREV